MIHFFVLVFLIDFSLKIYYFFNYFHQKLIYFYLIINANDDQDKDKFNNFVINNETDEDEPTNEKGGECNLKTNIIP